MKINRWLCLAGLVLCLAIRHTQAAEKSPVTVELADLVARIQSGIEHGKKTKETLGPELEGFDALLDRYAGEKTDDVAEILATQARLYLQVLDDSATARQIVLRLKREFPNTAQGRNVPELLAGITRYEDAQRIRSFLVIGSKFPEFSEKDTLRNQLTLSAYQGRVVLLEFWATWSKSSVAEVPQLVSVYNRYRTRGFEIIGISLDESQLKVSGFTARNQMRWPQFCDAATWKNKLAVKYGVNTLPANYLLDAEGKIIAKNLRGSELEAQVAAVLAKK